MKLSSNFSSFSACLKQELGQNEVLAGSRTKKNNKLYILILIFSDFNAKFYAISLHLIHAHSFAKETGMH